MGIYDEYNGIQTKAGEPMMKDVAIGDAVSIPDGVYVGWDGLIVVLNGRLAATFPTLMDYHGKVLPMRGLFGWAQNQESEHAAMVAKYAPLVEAAKMFDEDPPPGADEPCSFVDGHRCEQVGRHPLCRKHALHLALRIVEED